jgi:cytochrome c553
MTQGALMIATCAVMVTASVSAMAAGNAESGKAKATTCMACHGPDGNSPADTWPKLAGQMPEYITKQLHDFRAGLRSNEQMSPMAKPLSEQDIADLAAYFSSQQVKLGEGKQELLAQGQSIFFKGKGRPAVVAACTGCHGSSGGGKRDWNALYSSAPSLLAPAIGSQQPAYIVRQLKAYRDGTRANDIGHVMRNIAVRLDDNDIAAVAEYVATLSR